MLNQGVNTVAGHAIEKDIHFHGQRLRIIVLDSQEGVILFSVEILYGVEDKYGGGLRGVSFTTSAMMVKRPPVAEVSCWSVCILRKKSKDFSMYLHVIL